MKITIYTDGSSRGNPGRGGWAAVLMVDRQQTAEGSSYANADEIIELGGREDMTTNNRMELSGALHGLKEIDNKNSEIKHVEVCTDSQYVKKGMTEWIDGWIKRGWKGSTKKPVLNQDLWEAIKKEEDRLKSGGVKVSWKYVPGHSGVEMNERADVIATMCADDASDLQLYRGPKKDYFFQG
ncbi:MAG: ribonuclease H [Candidatus Paceibacterota bacterium]